MTAPSLLVALRWLDVLLLSVLAASVLTAHFPGSPRWQSRLLRFAVGLMIVLSGVVLLLVQSASFSGMSVAELDWDTLQLVVFETTFGQAWLCRQGAGLLIIALAAIRARATIAWLSYAPLGFALSPFGHPVAASQPVFATLTNMLHLAGVSLWCGGLMVLLTSEMHDANKLLRFSRFAMLCVAGITATGVALAWLLIPSLPGLIDSAYGWLLAAKLLFFAAILFIARKNKRAVEQLHTEEMDSGNFRDEYKKLNARVRVEIIGLFLAIAVAVWMGHQMLPK